jgi:hypothetical protein
LPWSNLRQTTVNDGVTATGGDRLTVIRFSYLPQVAPISDRITSEIAALTGQLPAIYDPCS